MATFTTDPSPTAVKLFIAITISTNYDDILQYILPQNQKFFDKWIIVTHKDDKKTIDLIDKFNFKNVELLFFDFYADGKIFNKGGAIKFAQKTIPSSNIGDVLLLDSDILLPDNFNDIIKNIDTKNDVLYGVRKRLDFHSYANLMSGKQDHSYIGNFHGFFQLYKFNPSYLYNDSINCSQCDLDFANLFETKQIIKDLLVKHLGKNAVNWDKRDKTDFVH